MTHSDAIHQLRISLLNAKRNYFLAVTKHALFFPFRHNIFFYFKQRKSTLLIHQFVTSIICCASQ